MRVNGYGSITTNQPKGLECVKAVKHGILHFKPEYHEALMETVENYTAMLTNDNRDLFLEV